MNLETFWEIVNSPAVISAFIGIGVYVINKVFDSRPTWAAYEGAIVSAVLSVEKIIPNDIDNKSLRKVDIALRFVLEVFEERNLRTATEAEKHSLLDGIQIKHAELKQGGVV